MRQEMKSIQFKLCAFEFQKHMSILSLCGAWVGEILSPTLEALLQDGRLGHDKFNMKSTLSLFVRLIPRTGRY